MSRVQKRVQKCVQTVPENPSPAFLRRAVDSLSPEDREFFFLTLWNRFDARQRRCVRGFLQAFAKL